MARLPASDRPARTRSPASLASGRGYRGPLVPEPPQAPEAEPEPMPEAPPGSNAETPESSPASPPEEQGMQALRYPGELEWDSIGNIIEETGLREADEAQRQELLPTLTAQGIRQNFSPEEWESFEPERQAREATKIELGIREVYSDLYEPATWGDEVAEYESVSAAIEQEQVTEAAPEERWDRIGKLQEQALRQNFSPREWAFLEPEKQEEVFTKIDEGLRETYPEVFTVELRPERTEEMPGALNRGVERTIPAVTRPLYGPQEEQYLADIRSGEAEIDFADATAEELIASAPFYATLAPERAEEIKTAAAARARELLLDQGYPVEEEDDKPLEAGFKDLQRSLIELAGGTGAMVQGAFELGLTLTGQELPDETEASEGNLLARQNRALAALAYPDASAKQFLRFSGNVIPYVTGTQGVLRYLGKKALARQGSKAGTGLTAGGAAGKGARELPRNVAFTRAAFRGMRPELRFTSRSGLAATASTSATIAALQGPSVAPSMVAEAIGVEPNRLTSAIEAGTLDLAVGNIIRMAAQSNAFQSILSKAQRTRIRGMTRRELERLSRNATDEEKQVVLDFFRQRVPELQNVETLEELAQGLGYGRKARRIRRRAAERPAERVDPEPAAADDTARQATPEPEPQATPDPEPAATRQPTPEPEPQAVPEGDAGAAAARAADEGEEGEEVVPGWKEETYTMPKDEPPSYERHERIVAEAQEDPEALLQRAKARGETNETLTAREYIEYKMSRFGDDDISILVEDLQDKALAQRVLRRIDESDAELEQEFRRLLGEINAEGGERMSGQSFQRAAKMEQILESLTANSRYRRKILQYRARQAQPEPKAAATPQPEPTPTRQEAPEPEPTPTRAPEPEPEPQATPDPEPATTQQAAPEPERLPDQVFGWDGETLDQRKTASNRATNDFNEALARGASSEPLTPREQEALDKLRAAIQSERVTFEEIIDEVRDPKSGAINTLQRKHQQVLEKQGILEGYQMNAKGQRARYNLDPETKAELQEEVASLQNLIDKDRARVVAARRFQAEQAQSTPQATPAADSTSTRGADPEPTPRAPTAAEEFDARLRAQEARDAGKPTPGVTALNAAQAGRLGAAGSSQDAGQLTPPPAPDTDAGLRERVEPAADFDVFGEVRPARAIGREATDSLEYESQVPAGGATSPPASTAAEVPVRPPEPLRDVPVPRQDAEAVANNAADQPGQVYPVPREQIAVQPDLMQFKRIEDAGGINQADRIADEADWDPNKAGNLLLWEPVDPAAAGLAQGQRYIVANGHHRMEFADRKGVGTMNAQIVREADGWSAQDARAYAAEINIADGKGSIYDQAKFLRNTAATYGTDAALARARQVGARGRKAATIALSAGDNLFDAFTNEIVAPDAAAAIAAGAPGDEAAQRAGIQLAQNTDASPASLQKAVGDLQRQMEIGTVDPQQTDMFGSQDAAINESLRLSDNATALQREIRERVTAIRGAGKRPQLAREYGIDVQDPASVQAAIEDLKGLEDRVANFYRGDDDMRAILARQDFEPAAAFDKARQLPSPEEATPQPAAAAEDAAQGGFGFASRDAPPGAEARPPGALDEAERADLTGLMDRVREGDQLAKGERARLEALRQRISPQDLEVYMPGTSLNQEAMRVIARMRERQRLPESDPRKYQQPETLAERAHEEAAREVARRKVIDPVEQYETFHRIHDALLEEQAAPPPLASRDQPQRGVGRYVPDPEKPQEAKEVDIPYRIEGEPDAYPIAVRNGTPQPPARGVPRVAAEDPATDTGWVRFGLGGIEKIRMVDMPELVELARNLTDNFSGGVVLKRLRGSAGMFRPREGDPHIVLDPRIFGNFRYAQQVLAHEIGHLEDFLPDETMARGNVLGRIGKLRGYLAKTLDSAPDEGDALTKQDRGKLRSQARSELRARKFDSDEERNAAVRDRYRELVREEIEARGLLSEEDLKNELVAWSEYWRPYDKAQAPASFVKYRESSPELYADFVSGLLVAPAELQKRVPKTWQGFFEYLDRRPEAKKEFFDAWDQLHAPLGVRLENRRNRRQLARAKGAQLMADEMDAKRARRSGWPGFYSAKNSLMTWFYDQYYPIIRRANKAEKAGQEIPEEFDPRKFFDEVPFANASHYQFVQDAYEKVIRPLEERMISIDELADYLEMNRIRNERTINEITGEQGGRAVLANPGGETPETAADALLNQKLHHLGVEGQEFLERQARRLQDLFFAEIEGLYKAGGITPQKFEELRQNRYNYAPFIPLEFISDQVPANLLPSKGTLKDIASPVQTLLLKGISVQRLAQRYRSLGMVRDFMREFQGDEIEQVQPVFRGGRLEAPDLRDPDRQVIRVPRAGKQEFYAVPKDVAQMIDQESPAGFEQIAVLLNTAFRKVFYPLFITYNPAFQLLRSPIMDLQRSGANLPEAAGRKMIAPTMANYRRLMRDLVRGGSPERYDPKTVAKLRREIQGRADADPDDLLALYEDKQKRAAQLEEGSSQRKRLEGQLRRGRKAYEELLGADSLQAVRDFLQGRPSSLIKEMLARRAISAPMDSFRGLQTDDAIGEIFKMFNLSEAGTKGKVWDLPVARQVRSLGRGIEFAGLTFEYLAKVQGYKILTQDLGYEKDSAARFVRNYVGVPNVMKRGSKINLVEGIFPFTNVALRGLTADLGLASKGDKLLKKKTGGPSGGGASSKERRGGYSRTGWWMRTATITIIPKILQRLAEAGIFGTFIAMLYDKTSEYDKSNYLPIPIGPGEPGSSDVANDGRKAVMLRIPQDETQRLIGAVTRQGMDALFATWGDDRPRTEADVPSNPAGRFGKFASDFLRYGGDQLPGLNPTIDIPLKWAQFVSGGTPRDHFRDRTIVTRRASNLGGWQPVRQMASWTIDASGVGNFVNVDYLDRTYAVLRGAVDGEPVDTTEVVTRAIPVVNNLLKYTDYGVVELQKAAAAEDQKKRDKIRAGMGRNTRELYSQYSLLRAIGTSDMTRPQRQRWEYLRGWHREIYQPTFEAMEYGMGSAEGMRERLEEISKRTRQRINESVRQSMRYAPRTDDVAAPVGP